MDNIYLHAIYAYYKKYNEEETIRILKYILKSNAILSRRLQMYRDPYGFNGLDYISLCDYDLRNYSSDGKFYYTAFKSYVAESLSIMIPKDKIEVIKPELVKFEGFDQKSTEKMLELGLSKDKRYSDLIDEVQVKDKIPLSLMSGVTMPVHKMTRPLFSEDLAIFVVQHQIDDIKKLLIKYNHEVPMYDINTFLPLEDPSNVKMLVKEYRQKEKHV